MEIHVEVSMYLLHAVYQSLQLQRSAEKIQFYGDGLTRYELRRRWSVPVLQVDDAVHNL